MSEENWIINQNHHKAIISRKKFDKVQVILNNTSNRVNRKGKYNILSGYVKCADCGKIMIIKKGKNNARLLKKSKFFSFPKNRDVKIVNNRFF